MNEAKAAGSRTWWFILAGVALGLLAGLGAAWLLRPHRFGGTVLETPKPAYDFSLTSLDGQPVKLSDLRGKAVLLFFGYTSCPDVCPTTLRDISKMMQTLGDKAGQVQPVFISVDPEKDTPRRLKGFLAPFDPRILGLSGSLAATEEVARQYGIYFAKRPYGSSGDYLVDHTAVLMLIDPNGYLKVIYPYGTGSQVIAADIAYILKR